MLKPQDLLVTLKLTAIRISVSSEPSISPVNRQSESAQPSGRWSYRWLSQQLDISVSEISAAIQRALVARLLAKVTEHSQPEPVLPAIEEFVIHGVKYVYPAEKGEPTRGIPTAYAAPVLSGRLIDSDELAPVWPYARGAERGYSLTPIYRSVASSAARDPILYDLLALVDVFRVGRARERSIGEEVLGEILR